MALEVVNNVNILSSLLMVISLTAATGCPGHGCKCYTQDTNKTTLDWCVHPQLPGMKIVECYQRNLTRVPKGIPEDTNVLGLRLNRISRVFANDLNNLTQLRCLDLSGNPLEWISEAPFKLMPLLNSLNIGDTKISIAQLTKVVCSLQSTLPFDLRIAHLGITSLGYQTNPMTCLLGLNLQELDIAYNALEPVDKCLLFNLTVLRRLNLVEMKQPLFQPSWLCHLEQLVTLYLQKNQINFFPIFTRGPDKEPVLPNLETLELSHNNLITINAERLDGLPRLRKLALASNRIAHLYDDQFTKLPMIQEIFLAFNFVKTIENHSFSTKSLKVLNLDRCDIEFHSSHAELFSTAPELEVLNLHANRFGNFSSSPVKFGYLFQNLTKLTSLDVGNCQIVYLPAGIFRAQYKLKLLNIAGNRIASLNPTWFLHLHSLEILHIDANIINNINQSSFPEGFLMKLENLTFADNPFLCDCSLVWLRRWMNTTNVTFYDGHNRHRYQCASPPKWKGKNLVHFNPTVPECTNKPLNIVAVLSASLTTFAVLTVAIFVIIYKYRWHISYIRFLVRARRRQYRELHNDRNYSFDAFVSYNRAELGWVKNQLLTRLEDDEGLRLCIHDRDWVLGADIVDNMVASIDNSRKIILVVSNAFAQSQWCQMEMTMAQHRLLDEDRNALILVLYEHVSAEHMTARLAFQMKTKTYLEWSDHELGQKLFWKQLIKAIQKPSSSIRDSPEI